MAELGVEAPEGWSLGTGTARAGRVNRIPDWKLGNWTLEGKSSQDRTGVRGTARAMPAMKQDVGE